MMASAARQEQHQAPHAARLDALSALDAPAALHLPEHLRDPAPEVQRVAIRHLADQADWTGLDWPELLDVLMALGRVDIPLSRLTEGHVDAMRILAEAGASPEPAALYGVWASRSGGTGLSGGASGAEPDRQTEWHVRGTLLFASGAGVLDRALVTVWPEQDRHVLLDAAVADWSFDAGAWHTRAMEHSRSHRAHLDGPVAARRIGADGFYLGRPGFFPGGAGVAAVWTGGAARVLDLLGARLGERPALPEPKRLRWGHARTELASAVALIRQTGTALRAPGQSASRTAVTLCRAGVGAAVRRLLEQVRTLAGPAGLAFDEDLTRAVDDLALYVAQQSQDGDAGHLGALP
ncbi:hypothetical protein ABDK96_08760 [Citricoccus nitrophenolicus]|uniref:Acyl-CoA dehydrogenase n=2 Tax=Citricoccus nitrophenolicus TaxID=863575 RepID=A0ABV0IHW7_9MICC